VKLAACSPLPDQTAVSSSNAWTDSFANIQCYDDLKVQAVLNEINGRSSDGSKKRPTPTLFGMNFQAVSVGQKLVESSISATGGYLDAIGTPSPSLLGEIEYVDQSLGLFVAGLNAQHLLENTLVIVTAKHGQSPIDPNRVARIPHDLPSDSPPSAILSPAGVGPGFPVAQADEDDISMLWLSPNDPATVSSAIATLEASAASTGLAGGELYSGPYLDLLFASTATDPRTPDIIVAPYVGVTYTGGGGKVAEHGGFAQDDRNVLLVVSNPALSERFVESPVSTTQVAPTILRSLGLDPGALDGVRSEHTPVLPGLELP
jgi:hypothetical protein